MTEQEREVLRLLCQIHLGPGLASDKDWAKLRAYAEAQPEKQSAAKRATVEEIRRLILEELTSVCYNCGDRSLRMQQPCDACRNAADGCSSVVERMRKEGRL